MVTRILAVGATVLLAYAAPLRAQENPWTVSLVPTVSPLAIGGCAPVRLTVKDPATKDWARNPTGNYVALTDFDLEITGVDATAVAGEFNGPSIWSVCACQAATPGSTATITATYPAASLDARKRAKGVAFKQTATFVIGPPRAASDVAPCLALKSQPAPTTGIGRSPPAELTGAPVTRAPTTPTTSTPLANPSTFTVIDRSLDRNIGGVDFKWTQVSGAVRYKITGTGLPATGVFSTGTTMPVGNTPSGPGSWQIVALYAGDASDPTTAPTASLVVRRLPPHPTPWLTHRNGAGSLSQVQTPKHAEFNDVPGGRPFGNATGDLLPAYDPGITWLAEKFYFLGGSGLDGGFIGDWFPAPLSFQFKECKPFDSSFSCSRIGLKVWLGTVGPLWDDTGQDAEEAVYGNHGDLGVGRRTYCEQASREKPVPGLYTFCYATAHGIPPGQAGFNDLTTITDPGAGMSSDFILSMVITKDPTGTVFLVFGKNGRYKLSPTVALDTQGQKFVPFVCLSCHGGTYNATTRKVDGASFLPVDPEMLVFASPAEQGAQEEKIREINRIIVESDPTSAVASYIRGLYGNAVTVVGKHATPDYVPQSWSTQAGFYRQVVRPYCTACHLAAPSSWNFASWGNFQGNAALIQASVCSAHTMPHSELQYKAFWTKDTGLLYLPGLLAATLGFPSCQ
jgi:hypothetical protein